MHSTNLVYVPERARGWTTAAPARRVADSHLLGMAAAIDGAAVLLGSILAATRWATGTQVTPVGLAVLLVAIASAVAVTILAGRRPAVEELPSAGLADALLAVALGAAALVAALALLGHDLPGAAAQGGTWAVTSLCALGFGRVCRARVVGRWLAAGRLARRVAVVGTPLETEPLARALVGERHGRHSLAGSFDDRATSAGSTISDLLEAARRRDVDEIVIAIPASEPERVHAALAALRSVVVEVHLLSEANGLGLVPAFARASSGLHTLAVHRPPLSEWARVQKAVFDRTMAAMMLLALSPVLLVAALAIRATSPGPVFFRQPRVGYDNRLFMMYKFRSMFADLGDLHASRQTSRDDPRVTPVGRVIRKYSVDELPQLINVLLGDMSLVGPRPHALSTRAEGLSLETAEAAYAVRHRVRPGITGWAQVNGSRGEMRTVAQVRARVAHDLHYIENWSMILDLRIMALTLLREVNSRRAF